MVLYSSHPVSGTPILTRTIQAGCLLIALGPFALAQDSLPPPAADPQPAVESASTDGSSAEKAAETNPWGSRYFPNVELTNHRGEKVRFFDDVIEGKKVMINFIYTTCADTCPLETARLTEVAEILGDRVGDDIFFYSITIDPDRDTPKVLAEYRERFGVGEGWDFLTGNQEDILLLRKKLGLYVSEEDKVDSDHNVNLLLGNQATGQWMRRTPFDNPYALAAQIGSRLGDYRQARIGTSDFEDAPTSLPSLSKAETLFESRCAVCHRIGVGDGRVRIGPNLLDVTNRREKPWLRRWLLEPDKVLEEGDPIAIGLRAAFNDVAMPNLGLSKQESAMLVDFLETEGRRVAKVEGNAVLTELKDKPLMECCEKENLGTISEDGVADDVSGDNTSNSVVAAVVAADEEEERAPVEHKESNLPFWLGSAFATIAMLLPRIKR